MFALAPAKAPEVDWAGTFTMWASCLGSVLLLAALVGAVVWSLRWTRANEEKRKAAIQAETALRQQARWDHLCRRFGPEAAARILRREFWQGQTAEMLIEAIGHPVDIEERVLKTKVKHVYKYQPMGANRYALRVDLENGIVIGWDQK